MLASLELDIGRAAVVLDTGAASRGSGNANTNKEKDVRKWFVEQDLIEGVIYLPENLFYNTTAPGIILFLNKAKPKDRKSKLFLLNASREFAKGDPKNYMTDDAILRIADTFKAWREEEKYQPHRHAAKRSPRTISISRPAATFTPVRQMSTGRSRRLWRSWMILEEEAKYTNDSSQEGSKKLSRLMITDASERIYASEELANTLASEPQVLGKEATRLQNAENVAERYLSYQVSNFASD